MGILDKIRQAFTGSGSSPAPVGKNLPVRPVTIGLDFGTSTTKCVVNLEGWDGGRDLRLAIAFPAPDDPRGTLCVPTAIGFCDDHFVFGHAANGLPENLVVRSFKMAIPCMGRSWGQYGGSFMLKDKPGFFSIGGREFSATDLAVLYLAHMLQQIRRLVSKHVAGRALIQPYVNMAAPMDQLVPYYEHAASLSPDDRKRMQLANLDRDTAVAEAYRALGQWALHLSEKAANPWNVDDAVASLAAAKSQGVLPFEKSPAYVVPETLAAVTGYINRPGTVAGRYMTFDVGAGTTDVAVFWLEKHDGVLKPWYYSAGSLHVGMDDIDRGLASVTGSFPGASPRERRQAFQDGHHGLKTERGKCESVLGVLRRHKTRIFGLGYEKEQKQSIWGDPDGATVTVLMLGGGCQVDVIRCLVTKCWMGDGIGTVSRCADARDDCGLRKHMWQNVIGPPRAESLTVDTIEQVLASGGRLMPLDGFASSSYLLAVAEGLSNKIVDIPELGVTTEPLYKRPVISPDDWFPDDWW